MEWIYPRQSGLQQTALCFIDGIGLRGAKRGRIYSLVKPLSEASTTTHRQGMTRKQIGHEGIEIKHKVHWRRENNDAVTLR